MNSAVEGLLAAAATASMVAAEPWSPADVSTAQFESHPAFDPRTGDLYFVRSSAEFTGWRILVSRCLDGRRAAAGPAPFSGAGVDADPVFTADGSRLYFISSRTDPPGKTGEDLDIWYVERGPGGRWRAPVRMPAPVNSPAAEWFPRPDGRGGLHFGSSRPGGFGATDIYRAVRDDDGRWQVRNVGAPVSTEEDDYEFEVARDGSFAVLMSGGALYRLDRSGAGWGPRSPIETGARGFHVGPTLSPSGRTLLYARRGAERSGEIFRQPMGTAEDWPPRCGGGAPPGE